MPFRIDYFKEGHQGINKPHYMLFNLTKKEYVKKHFNSKEGAIGFGKNAIRYREKTKSKVVKNKILPIKNV